MVRIYAEIYVLGVYFVTVLGRDNVNTLISGGRTTSIEELPWMASLRYNRRHLCGGSIIKACSILTAAHCVHNLNRWRLIVRVGSSRNDHGGYTVYVEKVIIHENYRSTPSMGKAIHDIAILRLTTPLSLSNSGAPPSPVALFEPWEQVMPGTLVVIAGWGYMGNKLTNYLQSLEVPIISTNRCNELYLPGIFPGQVCAGYVNGYMDACNGDSGGPLTFGNKQIGLVTYGSPCSMLTLPTVYTEIAYYRNWIDDHLFERSEKSAGNRTMTYVYLAFLFLYLL